MFSIRESGGESYFSYTLELLEPVISTERTGKPLATEDYIFGSFVITAPEPC